MSTIDIAGPYLVPATPAAQTPGAIVGSPPQWEDGSDATYAEATFTWDGTGARSDGIRGDLHPPGGIGGILVALTLTFRASLSSNAPTGSTLRPLVYINNAVSSLGMIRFDHWLSAWDTIETVTYAADELQFLNGYDLTSVGAAIAAGDAQIDTYALQPAGSGQWNRLRVYEVALDGTWRALQPPPLRRYPDGIGTGPTRHWPPPKSRRGYGGFH